MRWGVFILPYPFLSLVAIHNQQSFSPRLSTFSQKRSTIGLLLLFLSQGFPASISGLSGDFGSPFRREAFCSRQASKSSESNSRLMFTAKHFIPFLFHGQADFAPHAPQAGIRDVASPRSASADGKNPRRVMQTRVSAEEYAGDQP